MFKPLFNISRTLLIFSLLSSYAFSTEPEAKPDVNLQSQELKPKPQEVKQEKKAKKAKPKEHPLLFNATKDNFILEGDLLYWNLQGGDTSYILKTEPINSLYTKESYASTPFTYNPGMRFKLSYYRAKNLWEAGIEYTFIRFHSHSKQSASSAVSISSLFSPAKGNTLLEGKSSSIASYKTINLLANRVFLFKDNPHLRLRLDGGICFAWLKQDWKVKYHYSENIDEEVQNNWTYWGGGLRTALTFDWFWGDSIYLSGRFSPALVCGHLSQSSHLASFATSIPGAKTQLNYDDYRLSFNTNFSFGPSYQKITSWGRMEVFAGYELEMWTNIWEVIRLPELSPNRQITSNLFSMQGLTARVSLYF